MKMDLAPATIHCRSHTKSNCKIRTRYHSKIMHIHIVDPVYLLVGTLKHKLYYESKRLVWKHGNEQNMYYYKAIPFAIRMSSHVQIIIQYTTGNIYKLIPKDHCHRTILVMFIYNFKNLGNIWGIRKKYSYKETNLGHDCRCMDVIIVMPPTNRRPVIST